MRVLFAALAFLRLLAQSLLLALGQIWANKTRSVLTTTGIIIGVASVTAVIGALTGLKAKVLSDFEKVGTNRIGVWARRPESGPLRRAPWTRIKFYPQQFEGLLAHCPSVEDFTRTTGLTSAVGHGGRAVEDVQVLGIDPSWHTIENRSVILGRPFSLIDEQEGKRVCLITAVTRDRLLLDRECIGQTILIRNATFRIVGVVEPAVHMELFGGGPSERMEVFIPFGTAYRVSQDWMGIEAVAKSPGVAEEAKAEISFLLRRTRSIRPGDPDTFGVETVQRILEQFNKIALAITAVAGGVVGISLLVGGIGIMNIMLVSVSERTREIGLRKAVGAGPWAILLQFLVEAITLCLIGGLLGVVVGQFLTTAVARIPNAQLERAYIPAWAVGLSFGFATVVGLFFGMFPAVKAARLDPIEALRHE
jgi:putative ABC transport system permease protein